MNTAEVPNVVAVGSSAANPQPHTLRRPEAFHRWSSRPSRMALGQHVQRVFAGDRAQATIRHLRDHEG